MIIVIGGVRFGFERAKITVNIMRRREKGRSIGKGN